MKKRALLAWSSGKDSAWALHRLRATPGLEVAGLFTTIAETTRRVPIHEVPRVLLHEQAAAVGLPLEEIEIPDPCSDAVYELRVAAFAAGARGRGIEALAFGDLFLEDIRRYRERQFAGLGLELLFPLWGEPTRELASGMTRGGLRAWITTVDTARAPRGWAGACFDAAFVAGIPEGIDACGERGEFHTFAFDGPMFARPVRVIPGAVRDGNGFAHADLVSSAPC